MNVTEYCWSVAQSAIAAYSRLFLREPGCNFICEITLHLERADFLAESFQLGPFGLGQILVGNPSGFPGFLHPFA